MYENNKSKQNNQCKKSCVASLVVNDPENIIANVGLIGLSEKVLIWRRYKMAAPHICSYPTILSMVAY